MQTYTPLFSEVVDSSLWEEPLHVRVLFMTLMAVKDWDHVVRVEDHKLRRKANISDEQLLDGLKVLSEPDKMSKIPQPFDGRRIERVEDGWLLLNGNKYQRLMQEINKRARWAKQKRDQRARQALKNGTQIPGEALDKVLEQSGASQAERDRNVDNSSRQAMKQPAPVPSVRGLPPLAKQANRHPED